MREPARGSVVLLASVVLTGALLLAPIANAAAPAPLPIADGARFVGNISTPGLVAGSSGALGLTLSNPLSVPMQRVALNLSVYAFNGFPGNGAGSTSIADPPILSAGGTSGTAVYYNLSSLAPGAQVAESAGVTSSSATAAGAYAVRVALTFSVPNGTSYLLESRGWFTAAQWSAATSGPNGTTVLTNRSLALLGVSGILPETSIQVTSSTLSYALYIVLGAAFALAGAAGYVYYRRVARSRSGTR